MFLKETEVPAEVVAAEVAEVAAPETVTEGTEEVKNAGSLAEILYESEVTYGNIVKRMMAIEHKAILTEDENLLTEGVKEYWDTFIAWLKDWFKKVGAFFASLWERISSSATAGGQWLASKSSATFNKVKVSVHAGIAKADIGNRLGQLYAKIVSASSNIFSKFKPGGNAKADLISELNLNEMDSISDAVKQNILDSESFVEVEVDGKSFLAIGKSVNEIIIKIKGLGSCFKSAESQLEKVANEGKAGNEEAKEKASYGKSFVAALQSAIAAFTSACGTVWAGIRSIISKSIGGVKAAAGKVADKAVSTANKINPKSAPDEEYNKIHEGADVEGVVEGTVAVQEEVQVDIVKPSLFAGVLA